MEKHHKPHKDGGLRSAPTPPHELTTQKPCRGYLLHTPTGEMMRYLRSNYAYERIWPSIMKKQKMKTLRIEAPSRMTLKGAERNHTSHASKNIYIREPSNPP
jgi:hypothetical protein